MRARRRCGACCACWAGRRPLENASYMNSHQCAVMKRCIGRNHQFKIIGARKLIITDRPPRTAHKVACWNADGLETGGASPIVIHALSLHCFCPAVTFPPARQAAVPPAFHRRRLVPDWVLERDHGRQSHDGRRSCQSGACVFVGHPPIRNVGRKNGGSTQTVENRLTPGHPWKAGLRCARWRRSGDSNPTDPAQKRRLSDLMTRDASSRINSPSINAEIFSFMVHIRSLTLTAQPSTSGDRFEISSCGRSFSATASRALKIRVDARCRWGNPTVSEISSYESHRFAAEA